MKKKLFIRKPTLIIDRSRAMHNIERMAAKAAADRVRFRPHFKTHQSIQVGRWFRTFGVEAITVSSVEMAAYFAGDGWHDITIAFPVNRLEIREIDELAHRVDLNLLVESTDTAAFLETHLTAKVRCWIKVDTGYHRTGIGWDSLDEIAALAMAIDGARNLEFRGILTHAGHSYKAGGKAGLLRIYEETLARLQGVKAGLMSRGFAGVEISIGDTPTCSVVESFAGVDEIRCGNFVFYDVMQAALGSCREEDIAAAVACPVAARHADRNELLIYGGAVHLSKEYIEGDGRVSGKVYGRVCLPVLAGAASTGPGDMAGLSWGPAVEGTYVSGLSQEHGIIKTTPGFFDRARLGDLLMILPVHSCLVVNLMKEIFTTDGEQIQTCRNTL